VPIMKRSTPGEGKIATRVVGGHGQYLQVLVVDILTWWWSMLGWIAPANGYSACRQLHENHE